MKRTEHIQCFVDTQFLPQTRTVVKFRCQRNSSTFACHSARTSCSKNVTLIPKGELPCQH